MAFAVATDGRCDHGVGRGVHTRHRVLRLKAVASRTNSAVTLARPSSKKRRAPYSSLRMPNTGSFSFLRRPY